MANVENLTVQEALTAVLAPLTTLPPEPVALPDALGRVLAAPIVARDNLPPFANSSMDGYAFIAADLVGATGDQPATLHVIGDIAAGSAPTIHIERGTAVRIMTGAPIPPGADAVIPVEDTDENWRDKARPLPATIQINRAVKPGDYIRPPGGDIQAGQTVLHAGHLIRPQEIGLLAALGIAQLSVVRRPLIGILATGDELIPIDQPLQPGKIRNSNGYAQAAQVAALGAIPFPLGIARDSEADVRAHLQTGLDAGVDLFISSAGVSVGAYDVVKAVLEAEGNIGFWRVRMRPGKPLAYGSYKGIPYIGLPGNPVSAMVSFERFARAAILKMAGHTQLERPQVLAELQEEMESDGRESYIRAIVTKQDNGYTATPTGSQDSHMLTSLVRANALLIIPEGVRHVSAGDMLTAWLLDGS
ncbi:MAG: molybdopterin molybdotransferase MoeA [Anaerolineae bacterium]|nr:molybdopterin molybdotransferase MoeA [Anaerolineae bacterium]